MFRIPKGKCTRSGGIQNSQSTLYNSLNSFTLLPGADEWGRRVLYSARLPHLRVYASKRRCLFEASAPCAANQLKSVFCGGVYAAKNTLRETQCRSPAACGRAATLRLRAKSFLRRARRKKRMGYFCGFRTANSVRLKKQCRTSGSALFFTFSWIFRRRGGSAGAAQRGRRRSGRRCCGQSGRA